MFWKSILKLDQAGKFRRVKLDSNAGKISATDLKSAATLNEV